MLKFQDTWENDSSGYLGIKKQFTHDSDRNKM